jgi:ribosome-associated toxin RatA of RatAB toxin-antitoxin module
MADRTESTIEIHADPTSVMAVIADVEAYPDWAGVQAVEVRSRYPDDRPRLAWFKLEQGPVKDSYVLDYTWQDDESVSWTLAEKGSVLTALDGSYDLERAGASATKVTYRLSVDISIPMIGMIRRKAEKRIIDTALKGLKDRAER